MIESICLCSWKNGIDLTNAQFYSSLTLEELSTIFAPMSNTSPLPLLPERLEVLHQTGRILLKDFDGHFRRCIDKCGRNAVDLVHFVVRTFPAYRDECLYQGQRGSSSSSSPLSL